MPDPRDFLPPPPWEGPPVPRHLRHHITPLERPWWEWMTEHEMVKALVDGRVKVDELPPSIRETSQMRSVISEYEEIKAEMENPDIYWDKLIANSRKRLAEVEEAKRLRKPRPLPYRF